MSTPEPFVVNRAYRYRSHPGLHHWRVNVGILELLVVAPSHQAAKRAALAYWPLCNGSPETFKVKLAERIAKVGIRARREMRDCTAEMSQS